ncbi:MAG: hypothetical protein PHV34_21845 [Verrucomicrobiae bacterium]|nr:hypothetical protein [Verrucomicrobiae bacterium]
MNNHQKKISFVRIPGLAGVCFCLVAGFSMMGGNPAVLFILTSWFTVLGITWFALFATYGSDFLRRCLPCLVFPT